MHRGEFKFSSGETVAKKSKAKNKGVSLNVAIYPGTFDPVTRGHLDLICRGAKLFDHLVVGVAESPLKKPLFTLRERVTMIRNAVKHHKNVEVKGFKGLSVDLVRQKDANILLRGIRTVSDFEYEYQIALTNRLLAPDVETVFVMPGERFSFISSSIIKNIVAARGDATEFVTEEVNRKLKQKLLPRK